MNENKEIKTTHDIEEEINWRNVVKDPSRWFGFIYPLFLIAVIMGGFYYIDNMRTITRNEIENVMAATAYEMPVIEMKKGRMTKGVDVEVLTSPTQELLEKGRELYIANCSSCHGENGNGTEQPAKVSIRSHVISTIKMVGRLAARSQICTKQSKKASKALAWSLMSIWIQKIKLQ